MAASAFPVRGVISSFRGMELALEEFAEIVPFAPEHADVWSPRLASVLLDTCSQLDSLWRYELSGTPEEPDNSLSMADYAKRFGGTRKGCLTKKFVIFWGAAEKGEVFAPFSEWLSPDGRLSWWRAYNKVKHNRLQHRRLATFRNTTNAVAALLIAILRSRLCLDEVMRSDRLQIVCHYGQDPLRKLLAKDPGWFDMTSRIVIESKLFSYAVGISTGIRISRPASIPGGVASRFANWYEGFEGNVADAAIPPPQELKDSDAGT